MNKTEYLKAKLTDAIKDQFLEQCESWGISPSDALRDLAETFIIEHTCPYKVDCEVMTKGNPILVMTISGEHPTAMIFELPNIPGWTIETKPEYRVQMFGESRSAAVVNGYWAGVCTPDDPTLSMGRVIHEFTTRFHKIAAKMHQLDSMSE